MPQEKSKKTDSVLNVVLDVHISFRKYNENSFFFSFLNVFVKEYNFELKVIHD